VAQYVKVGITNATPMIKLHPELNSDFTNITKYVCSIGSIQDLSYRLGIQKDKAQL
jgi:hypothetical protein